MGDTGNTSARLIPSHISSRSETARVGSAATQAALSAPTDDPDTEVRPHARLLQSLQHPHLNRTQAGSAWKDEGDHPRLLRTVRSEGLTASASEARPHAGTHRIAASTATTIATRKIASIATTS